MQVFYIYNCHAHSAGGPLRASTTCRGTGGAQGICGCPLLAALPSCIILLATQLSTQQVSSLHLLTQLSLPTGQVHHIKLEIVSSLVLAYVRTLYHKPQVLTLSVTVTHDTKHSYSSRHVVDAEPLAQDMKLCRCGVAKEISIMLSRCHVSHYQCSGHESDGGEQ